MELKNKKETVDKFEFIKLKDQAGAGKKGKAGAAKGKKQPAKT